MALSTEKGLTDVNQRRGAVTELPGTAELKKMAEDHVNTDAGEHQGWIIVPLTSLRLQPFLLAPHR